MNQRIGTIKMNEYGLSSYFGGLLLLGLGIIHSFFYFFLVYIMIYVTIKRKIEEYQIYDDGISITGLNGFFKKTSRFIKFDNIQFIYCFQNIAKGRIISTNLKIKEIKGRTYIISNIDKMSSQYIINEIYKEYPKLEKSSCDDKQYEIIKTILVIFVMMFFLLILLPSYQYASENCGYIEITDDNINCIFNISVCLSIVLAVLRKQFDVLKIMWTIVLLTIFSMIFLTPFFYIFKIFR